MAWLKLPDPEKNSTKAAWRRSVMGFFSYSPSQCSHWLYGLLAPHLKHSCTPNLHLGSFCLLHIETSNNAIHLFPFFGSRQVLSSSWLLMVPLPLAWVHWDGLHCWVLASLYPTLEVSLVPSLRLAMARGSIGLQVRSSIAQSVSPVDPKNARCPCFVVKAASTSLCHTRISVEWIYI